MAKKPPLKRKIKRKNALLKAGKKIGRKLRRFIKKGKAGSKPAFSQPSAIPRVLIVAGSKSDISLMQETQKILEDFGVESTIHIASAHRSPELVREIAARAEQEAEVIIAGAGLAAALPGVLAAQTVLPVIGIPVKTEPLQGLDALVSIMQMPSGVPVAAVAINGAKNAALLAVQILGLKYPALREQFRRYKKGLASLPNDVQLA